MRHKGKQFFGILLSALLLCGGFTVQAAEDQMSEAVKFQPTIHTYYNITLEKASNVYISNEDTTDSNVIYMEYEVGEVREDLSNRTGFATMKVPLLYTDVLYNIGDGQCSYINFADGTQNPLLVPGARYYICFLKTSEGFELLVQRTVDGKSVNIAFPSRLGEWDNAFRYFALHFGVDTTHTVSCELVNFKCYDGNGKDLGIRLNNQKKTGKIATVGTIREHSICEGVYYCEERPELGMIVLGENQKGYRKIEDKTEEFSYGVVANGADKATLSLKFPDGKEVYSYQYVLILDDDENCYRKLKSPKVTFVVDDEVIDVVYATFEEGYRIKQPEAPQKDGFTFDSWYLGNEEKYDFDTVVTESLTLYARWNEGHGNEYVQVGNSADEKMDVKLLISVIGSIVIGSGCIVGSVLILRGKKHGRK